MGANALATLADKLITLSSPPSLRSLLARLESAEDYAEFMNLVREYVPERENEIKRLSTPAAQIAEFASAFENRYFPLWYHLTDGDVEEYAQLTNRIPIVALGFDYDDYDRMETGDYPNGITLMSYLFQHPYEAGDQVRVPLAAACAKIVPAALLLRVPAGGMSTEEVHRLLDETRFEGVALWGDRLNMDTGNSFFDNSMENAYENTPDWDKELVEDLKQEWLKAQALDQKVQKVREWLEKDEAANYAELLDFIDKQRAELDDGTNIAAHMEARKQQLRLPLYQPSESDKVWLSNLMHTLADGGTWQAPMGFCFEKISRNELKLKWVQPGHDVMEAIQQTIATGKAIGIKIDTDGKLLEGGGHDANEGMCSRGIGLVPAPRP